MILSWAHHISEIFMRLLISFSRDLLSDLFRITLAICFDDEGILCRSHRCCRRRRR